MTPGAAPHPRGRQHQRHHHVAAHAAYADVARGPRPPGAMANATNTSSSSSTSPDVGVAPVLLSLMGALLVAALLQGASPSRVLRLLPAPILVFLTFLALTLVVIEAAGSAPATLRPQREALGQPAGVSPATLQAIFLPPLITNELLHMNATAFRRASVNAVA